MIRTSSYNVVSQGLSLSGGDDVTVQEQFKTAIRKNYPDLAKNLYVSSDTNSALAAAFPNGNFVCYLFVLKT